MAVIDLMMVVGFVLGVIVITATLADRIGK